MSFLPLFFCMLSFPASISPAFERSEIFCLHKGDQGWQIFPPRQPLHLWVKCGICLRAQGNVLMCSEQTRVRSCCINRDTEHSTAFIWNNKGKCPNWEVSRAHYRPWICCLACKVPAWSVWLPRNHCWHLGSAANTTDIRSFPLAPALEAPLVINSWSFSTDTIFMHLWLWLWWPCCSGSCKITLKTCVDIPSEWKRLEEKMLGFAGC